MIWIAGLIILVLMSIFAIIALNVIENDEDIDYLG
jgi:hypothetical protein